MPTFKTKDGKRVSFKTKSKAKRKASGSTMSKARRLSLSRAAKARPRYKTGPNKGKFKKAR